ncbi:hypothetical protein M5J15_02145 [Serratia symbiotica]|nr:hypothetical protein [Serratia symbiotica]USS96008.1 hypothetical protein M5J15_02145 [Serratia symbiotica]
MVGATRFYHRVENRGVHRTGEADYPHRANPGGRCMNITFTPEPIPELTLAELGF